MGIPDLPLFYAVVLSGVLFLTLVALFYLIYAFIVWLKISEIERKMEGLENIARAKSILCTFKENHDEKKT